MKLHRKVVYKIKCNNSCRTSNATDPIYQEIDHRTSRGDLNRKQIQENELDSQRVITAILETNISTRNYQKIEKQFYSTKIKNTESV